LPQVSGQAEVTVIGLTGHLVMAQHCMDDIPLVFVDNREVAVKYANLVDANNPLLVNPEYWCSDASTPMFISVVDFENGIPTKIEIIRSLDEEPDCVQVE
jgi:hypothetical protein